jgi:hypothetical protein
MDDRTCFYYMNDLCYNKRNKEGKCCDPTPECGHYRRPFSYPMLKETYLRLLAALVERAASGTIQ